MLHVILHYVKIADKHNLHYCFVSDLRRVWGYYDVIALSFFPKRHLPLRKFCYIITYTQIHAHAYIQINMISRIEKSNIPLCHDSIGNIESYEFRQQVTVICSSLECFILYIYPMVLKVYIRDK